MLCRLGDGTGPKGPANDAAPQRLRREASLYPPSRPWHPAARMLPGAEDEFDPERLQRVAETERDLCDQVPLQQALGEVTFLSKLPLTLLSELDAVNAMLESIGEQPVNTLETSGISEVSIARDTLHAVSRQVQAAGLHFNSEEGYTLPMDTDGQIIHPANTLKVDATDPGSDYVQRGNRLFSA